MRGRITSLVCISALIASTLTVSSTSGATPLARSSKLATGGTLIYLVPTNPGTLDPIVQNLLTTQNIDGLAYDTVVNENAKGKIVSGLADKWLQSGNTYTFTIRSGITCSTGAALTASTVANNINYEVNPSSKSDHVTIEIPKGATAIADAANSTVKITLPGPWPFFLEDLAQMKMVCTKGLSDPSILAEGTDGSGPFVLSKSVPGSQYTFTVRHGYDWGPGGASTNVAGMPGRITVKVVTTATTAATELLTGEANIAAVSGPEESKLKSAGLYRVNSATPFGELWFNQAHGRATATESVRRALVMGLDRPLVGKVLTEGQGEPGTGMVTEVPTACSGSPAKGAFPPYDPAKAKRVLTQAGWKLSKGGVREKAGKKLSLTVFYLTTAGGDPSDAFTLASEEWRKLGIKVNLKPDTGGAIVGVMSSNGAWDVVNIGNAVRTPNTTVGFVSGPPAPKGKNWFHVDNTTYNRLVAAARTKPGTSGCGDWEKATVALFHTFDVVPYENLLSPTWGRNTTFKLLGTAITPTSIRLHQS